MTLAFVYVIGIVGLLALSIPVGAALFMLGLGTDLSKFTIINSMIGSIAWNTMNDFILVAVPMFILLGEILTRSGLADRMYRSLAIWIQWLPGGLLHANIATCALFAAASGSSVATAATVGTVAQPTLLTLRYDDKLVLGSIAAGGTLGILIPPSMNMIVYGALTSTSVGKLFAAGIIPGIILALIMSLVIIVVTLVKGIRTEDLRVRMSLGQRLLSLLNLLPVLGIFFVVMGSIYSGLATPTEAAALGVVAAIALAAGNRTLSIALLHESFRATVKTTAMMLLIITGAFVLNFSLSLSGVPQTFATWVTSLNLGPYQTIWILVIFYLILGCFLEAMAMLVTTIGVVFPLVIQLGFDPVWFGIFMVVMMELATITPPVGLNLFVVQNIRIRPGSITDIYRGIVPFVAAMFIFTAILIYMPEIALWLPSKMF